MRPNYLPMRKKPDISTLAEWISKFLYVLESLIQGRSICVPHVKLNQGLHQQHGEKRDDPGHPLRSFDHQGHPGQVEHV